MELGPKDLAKGACVLVRRDDRSKETVPLEQAVAVAQAKLEAMQTALFQKARDFRDAHTFEVGSLEELKARADDGPGRAVVRRSGLRGADQERDRRRHLPEPALQPPPDARQVRGVRRAQPGRDGLVQGVLTRFRR
jgi:prolyl-tRNA synthetase